MTPPGSEVVPNATYLIAPIKPGMEGFVSNTVPSSPNERIAKSVPTRSVITLPKRRACVELTPRGAVKTAVTIELRRGILAWSMHPRPRNVVARRKVNMITVMMTRKRKQQKHARRKPLALQRPKCAFPRDARKSPWETVCAVITEGSRIARPRDVITSPRKQGYAGNMGQRPKRVVTNDVVM
jgi:hypothetical protein